MKKHLQWWAPIVFIVIAMTSSVLFDVAALCQSVGKLPPASGVKDPIAVPYLRRALLSKKLVEPLAIKGLEQIANEAAVRVLIESLKVVYADTAVLSRSALTRIRNQTHDPELRHEIDHVLM
jgi:HEAT repeat protein